MTVWRKKIVNVSLTPTLLPGELKYHSSLDVSVYFIQIHSKIRLIITLWNNVFLLFTQSHCWILYLAITIFLLAFYNKPQALVSNSRPGSPIVFEETSASGTNPVIWWKQLRFGLRGVQKYVWWPFSVLVFCSYHVMQLVALANKLQIDLSVLKNTCTFK